MKFKEVIQRVFFAWWFGTFVLYVALIAFALNRADGLEFIHYNQTWLFTWWFTVGLIYLVLRLLGLLFDFSVELADKLFPDETEKRKRDAEALATVPIVVQPDVRTRLMDQDALAWLTLPRSTETRGAALLQRLQTEDTL